MKRKKIITLLLTVVLMLTSCILVNNVNTTAKTSKTAKLQIVSPTKSSSYTFTKVTSGNEYFNLKYKITNGKKKAVTFTSSNKKVATIDKKGKVTIKKAGNTNIKVTAKLKTGKKVTDSLKLKVVNSKVEIISPTNKDTYNYFRSPSSSNEYFNIKYKLTNGKKKSDSYVSTNPSVAGITSDGKVVVKKAGGTTIKVIITMTNGKKVTDSVKVVVSNAKVDITSPTSATTYNYVKTSKADETFTLKHEVNTTSKKVTYSSDNESVATVSTSGKVTVKKEGTATIKISVLLPSDGTVSDTLKLIIKEDIDESVIGTEECPHLYVFDWDYTTTEWIPPHTEKKWVDDIPESVMISYCYNCGCIATRPKLWDDQEVAEVFLNLVEEGNGYVTDDLGNTRKVIFEDMEVHQMTTPGCWGSVMGCYVRTGRTYGGYVDVEVDGYYKTIEYKKCLFCGERVAID